MPQLVPIAATAALKCCSPVCCSAVSFCSGGRLTTTDVLADMVVRVLCNNDECHYASGGGGGGVMHRACFDAWEQTVLQYVARTASGRARSWTDRQRHQNLWTKKGYDLAYKACGCLCGKGHLRKDVSAVGGASAVGPAGPVVAVRQNQAAASMGRGGGGRGGGPSAPASRHTNNNNGKGMKPATLGQSPPAAPTTSMTSGVKTTPASGGGGPPAAVLMMNHQHQQMLLRNRANSLSSTGSTASSASSSTANSSGSSSPPMAGGGGGSGGSGQQATMPPLVLSTIVGSAPSSLTLSSASSVLNGHGPGVIGTRRRTTSTIDSHHQQLQLQQHSQPGSTTTDRSGNSGLFLHRADFSAFNALPRHKLNSFHIKMEDEGSYGNDDIRCFILSNLAMHKMSRTFCVVCTEAMRIYDRYPLVDGTFFLSPKQYSKACIPVTVEGRQQHLSAVCMSCLEGWTCWLRCRSCRTPWNGSQLILGTMYSYDVFAAVPCCPDRLRCNDCAGLVVQPDHRYQFFSQYSRDLTCPNCSSHGHHFVKRLPTIYQLYRHPLGSPSAAAPASTCSSSSSTSVIA